MAALGSDTFIVKNLFRAFCCISLVGAASIVPLGTAHADVKAGVDAWSAGKYEAAVKEWKPLAAAGDPDAQFNLAQAYKLGRGVPQSLEKAEQLYGQAAAKGHVQASDVYGLLLFQRGEHARAMPFIEASAARGDPRAQYILGLAYFNGDDIAKDWVRAYALVSLAQQAGLPQASSARAQMDEYIPLEDRQKSVKLATRLAADAQATHARQAAAAELGSARNAPSPPSPKPAASPSPKRVSAEPVISDAQSPATAGADYTRATVRPAPKSPAKTASAPSNRGSWRVQLGAFGVSSNADLLWAKLRKRPELAGHGKVLVTAGKLTKLQAGGFASRAEADAACSSLSSAGIACLAVKD